MKEGGEFQTPILVIYYVGSKNAVQFPSYATGHSYKCMTFIFFLYSVPNEVKPQYEDNIKWIKKAQENKLVVGSQARILYSDQKGRVAIALAFNQAIASKKIQVSKSETISTEYFNPQLQK